MDVTVELIGPEKAKQYLKLNTGNRRLRGHWVDHLKVLMLNGEFVENGDAIRFDLDGHLIDGQHKLTAIVESGKSYHFPVVRGLPETAFETIDDQLRRQLADALGSKNFKNVNLLASAFRMVLQYSTNKRNLHLTRAETWPIEKTVSWLRENPLLEEYCSLWTNSSLRKLTKGLITGSMSAALTFITSEGSGDCQFDYWKKTLTGEGLDRNTGAFWLYHRFRSETADTKGKLPRWLKLYLAIKAWNKDWVGVPVRTLSIAVNEQLPRVEGFDRKFGNLVQSRLKSIGLDN